VVDSIAQGRIWAGSRAIGLGLADRLGGLEDAISCAARMAKLKEYRLKEYPEPMSWWERLFGGYSSTTKTKAIKEEVGEEGFQIFTSLKKIRGYAGSCQARLPFEMSFEF